MAGIIVELIISWLLLWLFCSVHPGVLGIAPTRKRMLDFIVGIVLAASCCTIYQILTTAFVNNRWIINAQATTSTILEGFRWTIISVLYEELIFRGALLFITIRKIGIIKASVLSAVSFGIYHWFTYNLFGNPMMMTITFLMTALVGLSWAFAFARTGSLYLPIGLHLGWNLVCTVLFSNGNAAQSVLVKINSNQLTGLGSWLVFLFQVFSLPVFTFWYLHHHSSKEPTNTNQIKELKKKVYAAKT
jgi:CAAX protease family protein